MNGRLSRGVAEASNPASESQLVYRKREILDHLLKSKHCPSWCLPKNTLAFVRHVTCYFFVQKKWAVRSGKMVHARRKLVWRRHPHVRHVSCQHQHGSKYKHLEIHQIYQIYQ